MENRKTLSEQELQKLANISARIVKVYGETECSELKGSCLNSIRQSLEYLCLFTCDIYQIKIMRRTKKGDLVENESPTLGDMAPQMEKYFKENEMLWSKEVGMHIGSIWIVGNLGSHAQKEMLHSETEISKATVENALNSMFIVTRWFYKHYEQSCPIEQKHNKNISGKEREIITKSNQLYEKLANLKQQNEENTAKETPLSEETIDKFDDIYFDDLIEAIELGQCILFLGPDLSINEKGESLHNLFYKSISRRNIEYNEKDSFFMPKAEKQIELKSLNYYSKKFPKENVIGKKTLEKLARIPFSLSISVTPDNTMHQVFEQYNKRHDFLFYNPRTKHEIHEPTKEKPVIFNMLGNTAADGKYIFTHKQFYDYVNQKQEVKIPFEIETKIKDVAHYLFLGIDFNKWYNRLLLFALNLYDDAEAYGFNNEIPDETHLDFVNKQFNISFIEENHEEFVDVLLQKCEKENLAEDLLNIFIENTIEDIAKISETSKNTDILEKLENIEEKINSKMQ